MRLVVRLFFAILCIGLLCCRPNVAHPEGNVDRPVSIRNDIMYLVCRIDTSRVELMFDTGCLLGCLIPDTTAKRVLDAKSITYSINNIGAVEADSVTIAGYAYGTNLIHVIRGDFHPQIAPDYASDRHVWRINLDSCTFEISDSTLYNNIRFPLVFSLRDGKRDAPFVKLPLKLCADGDTLKTSYYYMLDTGTPYAMAITDPPKELYDFVSRHPNMEYVDELSSRIKNRKIVQFSPDIVLGSSSIGAQKCIFDIGLRSMRSEFGRKLPNDAPVVGTIGLRFLKNYNFEIDLAGNNLCLQENKAEFPSKPNNKYDFWCTSNGQVRRIGIGGLAHDAGLQIGDYIIEINGNSWESLTRSELDSLSTASDAISILLKDGREIMMMQE